MGQGEFGLDVRFAVPVPDPRDGWDVECELREEMARYLAARSVKTGDDLVPHLGTELPAAMERESDQRDGAADQAADAA